jgi:hypothetical protein
MSVARTARRRRKQAANGFSHLAKQQRPRYRKTSVAKLERREQQLRQRQQEIQSRGRKKK